MCNSLLKLLSFITWYMNCVAGKDWVTFQVIKGQQQRGNSLKQEHW